MFVGMAAVTLTSIVESVGDYYMTAKYCGLPPPPKHAVNRGITMEGVGSVLSGLMGAGHATTSYSQNVGFVNLTKVRPTYINVLCFFLLDLVQQKEIMECVDFSCIKIGPFCWDWRAQIKIINTKQSILVKIYGQR